MPAQKSIDSAFKPRSEQMDIDEFTANEIGASEPIGVERPALSINRVMQRLRDERGVLTNAIESLERGEAQGRIERMAVVLAILGRDYPANNTDSDLGPTWEQHRVKLGDNEHGKPVWGLKPESLKRHGTNAVLALQIASDVIKSGELSALALYKSRQELPAEWDNLHPVELARAATERATQYYRGRLFE
jgi:hypothetical protein